MAMYRSPIQLYVKNKPKQNQDNQDQLYHLTSSLPIEHQKWKQNNHQGNYLDSRKKNLCLNNEINHRIMYMKISMNNFDRGLCQQDQEFPSKDQSITGKSSNNKSQYIWKKTSQYFKNNKLMDLKANTLKVTSIKKGKFNNQYFIVVLAALLKQQHPIVDIFLDLEQNQNKYALKFFNRGHCLRISVDDWIPFQDNQPIFSEDKDGYMWLTILEKAWAKFHKSYKKAQKPLNNLTVSQTLYNLTGAPTIRMLVDSNNTQKIQENWKIIKKNIKSLYIMIAFTKQKMPNSIDSHGIEKRKCYTIINYQQIMHEGKNYRILRLRNNLGEITYTKYEKIWQQICKGKVEKNSSAIRDKGKFYIEYQDFIKYFETIQVCQVINKASYVYEMLEDTNNNGVYFTIYTTIKGTYWFQVYKENKFQQTQLKLKQILDDEFNQQSIKNNKSKQISPQFFENQNLFYQSYNIEQGYHKFVVFVRIKWEFKDTTRKYHINLACYGENPCAIAISSLNDVQKFQQKQQKQTWLGEFYKYYMVDLKTKRSFQEKNMSKKYKQNQQQIKVDNKIHNQQPKLMSYNTQKIYLMSKYQQQQQRIPKSENKKNIQKQQNPKKMLKTKQKLNQFSYTAQKCKKDQKSIVIQKFLHNQLQRVVNQYKNRPTLKNKIKQKYAEKVSEEIVQNGNEILCDVYQNSYQNTSKKDHYGNQLKKYVKKCLKNLQQPSITKIHQSKKSDPTTNTQSSNKYLNIPILNQSKDSQNIKDQQLNKSILNVQLDQSEQISSCNQNVSNNKIQSDINDSPDNQSIENNRSISYQY